MVEATGGHQSHPQIAGIESVSDEKAKKVIDKVIDKIVRVDVMDGRTYLGILKGVDQTKTIFVQDGLELIDKRDEHYIHHEVLTPEILWRTPKDQQ